MAGALVAPTNLAAVSGASIAKLLASCNKSARNRAVRLLTTWLAEPSAASAVSDADLLKIWKGLFYCVWHADKLPVQLDLINRLAGLIPSLSAPLATRYLAAFLSTIRREWSGIDFLRLDKFYLLIRRFLHQLFLLLANHSWNPSLSSPLISLLAANDKHAGQGVNYHIAEIFLDELSDFLPVSAPTLDILLQPFHMLLVQSQDTVLWTKIRTNIFDRLLHYGTRLLELESGGDHPEPGSDVEKLGTIALVMGFSKKFYQSTSDGKTPLGNRKILCLLHDGFLKLEKDLEESGVHVELPENVHVELPENGNVEKGPEAVAPQSNGVAEDQPSSKKRKKSKKASDVEKKSKTKKNKKKNINETLDSAVEESEEATIPNGASDTIANDGNGGSANDGTANDGNAEGDYSLIAFDEPVISNLQKQFEKVAAEAGMTGNVMTVPDLPATPVNTAKAKKRKRTKSVDRKVTVSPGSLNGISITGKSGEKSAKKVRFSMKNNLVWKPQSPLPPQNLRVPPAATPRGSALKKGVPPGPIKEASSSGKKAKSKSSSSKKVRKVLKAVSPSVKRLRKLQNSL